MFFSSLKRKAGVCAYVKSNVAVTRVTSFEKSCKDYQLLWLKVSLHNSSKHICCLYRSPNNPEISPLLEHLTNCIESIQENSPTSEIIILGDFNVHNADWLRYSSSKGIKKVHGTETETFAILNCLTQLVKDPTHIPDIAEQKANTLDLYLTSKPEIYHQTSVSAPIGSSDHCLVSAAHNFNHTLPAPTGKKIYYYKKAAS